VRCGHSISPYRHERDEYPKRAQSGLAVSEICRELGISTATFYNWRGKYGGMEVSMMARMKDLEAENARLRKIYVEEKIKAGVVAEALAKKIEAIQILRNSKADPAAAPLNRRAFHQGDALAQNGTLSMQGHRNANQDPYP
jgi:putative transposase